MRYPDYLLFIDVKPITDELSIYFANFKIGVVEQNSLEFLNTLIDSPLAILIAWSLIKDNPIMIHQIYERHAVPLLIMHEVMDERICIQVLEAGADDFILKPLQPRELHARISAITRRIEGSIESHFSPEKIIYQFAEWYVYPSSRQIFDTNSQELLLSTGEYDLLLAFVQQPQQILSREFLLQITKNTDLNPFDRRIDVQISRLRKKIETDAKKQGLIKTIRNGGYMFTTPVVILKASDL